MLHNSQFKTLMRSDYKNNAVAEKSKRFAIKCILLYKELTETGREYIVSRQFVRSGTSIGANVREALRAQSKADFIAKLHIAMKEASETEYWLELLEETGYIADSDADTMLDECAQLISILHSIIKSTRQNQDSFQES